MSEVQWELDEVRTGPGDSAVEITRLDLPVPMFGLRVGFIRTEEGRTQFIPRVKMEKYKEAAELLLQVGAEVAERRRKAKSTPRSPRGRRRPDADAQ